MSDVGYITASDKAHIKMNLCFCTVDIYIIFAEVRVTII